MSNEKIIYRPPMEYDSLIIQVTEGCAHNKCTFCTMYKDRSFKIRDTAEIIEELKAARKIYSSMSIKKIFLADGDAFVIKTESIMEILKAINEFFPECEHVASYARFTDVIRKSPAELEMLRENGLKKLYLGMESGSNKVLELVNKNSNAELAIKACKLLKDANITSYLTVLLGLGGKKLSQEHINQSAEALNKINPDFISLMTLIINENMELMNDVNNGKIELLPPNELVREALSLVKKLELNNTNLRINHASNFVNLEGIMPYDKNKIISKLESALDENLDLRDNYRIF